MTNVLPYGISETEFARAMEYHDNMHEVPSGLVPPDAIDVIHAVGMAFTIGELVPKSEAELVAFAEAAYKAKILLSE